MDKINKLIRIKRKICKVQNVISIEDIYRSTNSAGSGGKNTWKVTSWSIAYFNIGYVPGLFIVLKETYRIRSE
jgi:hypothetical protein